MRLCKIMSLQQGFGINDTLNVCVLTLTLTHTHSLIDEWVWSQQVSGVSAEVNGQVLQ